MKWYIKCFKQYADFSGRARRKEYWMFVLFNIIFCFATIILSYVLSELAMGGGDGVTQPASPEGVNWGFFGLYVLATLFPMLAVSVRRLHDVGKSGWNYFIGLIPLVGAIILIVWLCTDSQADKNKWGVNPKLATNNYMNY